MVLKRAWPSPDTPGMHSAESGMAAPTGGVPVQEETEIQPHILQLHPDTIFRQTPVHDFVLSPDTVHRDAPVHSADCRLGFLGLFFLNPCFAVTQNSQHLIDNVLGARACDAVEIAEHPRGGKIGVHLAVCNFPAEVIRVTVVF